jgi:hypothetical protein
MKKLLTSFLVLVVAIGLFAAGNPIIPENQSKPLFKAQRANRDMNILFEEGFEEGIGDWTTVDATSPTDWNEEWHLSTTGAYEGNSWWMGDEGLGGYTNHRYLVLDTPAITLSSSAPELNFMFSLNCEDPGVSDPYDAWDGANIRISTDGGTTWTVIEGTPAYNGTSFYSFGFEFGEGPGVPGWGSTTNWVDWTPATFDLSDYAGQEVMIRFAFASDPAYSTEDDPNMFGFRVDDIVIDTSSGTFESNGDGAAGDNQMVTGYGGEISGDFWEITSDNAHNGSQAAHCSVEPNLLNGLISPVVTLPNSAEIYMDYWVYCAMPDSDGDGDNSLEDYYFAYAKGVEEDAWTQLHYNFQGPDAGGVAEVWTLIDQEYALATFGWQDGTCEVTSWAGQDIQLKFEVKTDDNDDGGVGDGLYIDDVRVYNMFYAGPPPENVTAEATEDYQVNITWDAPAIGGEEGWLQWDNGTYYASLGLTEPGEWQVASKFGSGDILPYVGGEITTVEFMPGTSTTSEYTVAIWTGAGGGTLLTTQPVTSVTPETLKEITLDEPVTLEAGQTYWIGYQINQVDAADPNTGAGYSAGFDQGPAVNGLWMATTLGGNFSDYSSDFNYNWVIHGWVEQPDGKVVKMQTQQEREDPTSYKIYHSETSGGPYELVEEVGLVEEYTHTTPLEDAYNYYVVTAMYGDLESDLSNEAVAFVPSSTSVELFHDDGTSESGYNVGVAKNMAVKFNPDYEDDTITVTYAKVFVHELNTGQLVLRVWDDDGADGMPGTQLVQQAVSGDQLQAGWNTIGFDSPAQITEGGFYLGIFEMAGLSAIGLDESGSGYSYTNDGGWALLETGNLMIRAIVEGANSSNEEDPVPVASAYVRNYPNPFNPETTIELNMEKAGKATIKIYNLRGQLVKTLLDETVDQGITTRVWNGTDEQGNAVTSGVYFYKLQTADKTLTEKMILMK